MAYSGQTKVMPFIAANHAGRVIVANTGIDISVTGADSATLIVPIPLIISAFGVYVMEDLGASATGGIFLDSETVMAGGGSLIVLAEIDLDSTSNRSGNVVEAASIASTGSEDVDAGDVIFASNAVFPITMPTPRILTVRHVQSSSVTGEVAPFIVARWLQPDFSSTEQWTDIT